MAFKGDVLRRWRKERGDSQVSLAAALGITQTYLSEIETGAKRPGFGLVEDIATVTGIPIGELSDCSGCSLGSENAGVFAGSPQPSNPTSTPSRRGRARTIRAAQAASAKQNVL